MPEALSTMLAVHGLSKNYGSLNVIKNIDIALRAGEKIALIGPSGAGKSTCLRCINFLEEPTGGEIFLDGERIGWTAGPHPKKMSKRQLAPQRAQMGMVFQNFNLWPHLSVRENVATPVRKVRGLGRKESYEIADAMLAKVHMENKTDAHPSQLSGGQQQRVAIARALAQQPKLMLFDEPTSALDPELVSEVLSVIRALADEGRTMLLVTHEIPFAAEVADRVLFFSDGVIVEEGPARPLIANPQHERTKRFLGTMLH